MIFDFRDIDQSNGPQENFFREEPMIVIALVISFPKKRISKHNLITKRYSLLKIRIGIKEDACIHKI
jgi:hypothetical protein